MVNILITFQEENGNVEVCKYLRKFAFSTEKELDEARQFYNELDHRFMDIDFGKSERRMEEEINKFPKKDIIKMLADALKNKKESE